MSTLETVRRRLDQKYPQLSYSTSGDTLTVHAPVENGHEVWLTESDDGWTIGYDGWHEHFADETEALDCFAYGFSGECRLRVCIRGKCEYRWSLEIFQDGDWCTGSTTGLLFFPFWRERRVEYRQNPAVKEGS